jgi:hypothetical protein
VEKDGARAVEATGVVGLQPGDRFGSPLEGCPALGAPVPVFPGEGRVSGIDPCSLGSFAFQTHDEDVASHRLLDPEIEGIVWLRFLTKDVQVFALVQFRCEVDEILIVVGEKEMLQSGELYLQI